MAAKFWQLAAVTSVRFRPRLRENVKVPGRAEKNAVDLAHPRSMLPGFLIRN
jgi:hypothetical protein